MGLRGLRRAAESQGRLCEKKKTSSTHRDGFYPQWGTSSGKLKGEGKPTTPPPWSSSGLSWQTGKQLALFLLGCPADELAQAITEGGGAPYLPGNWWVGLPTHAPPSSCSLPHWAAPAKISHTQQPQLGCSLDPEAPELCTGFPPPPNLNVPGCMENLLEAQHI